MKELLEGRRFGFAIRPVAAGIALGLGLAITIVDLMAWLGWGVRETNALVVAGQWLGIVTVLLCAVGVAAALAEMRDVPEDEASLARLDALSVGAALLLYLGSSAARALDPGAAASSPPAFLMALAGLIVLGAGSGLSSLLYAPREWEETLEAIADHHRRRRVASR